MRREERLLRPAAALEGPAKFLGLNQQSAGARQPKHTVRSRTIAERSHHAAGDDRNAFQTNRQSHCSVGDRDPRPASVDLLRVWGPPRRGDERSPNQQPGEMLKGTRRPMIKPRLGGRGARRRRSYTATSAPCGVGGRRGYGDGRHHPRPQRSFFSPNSDRRVWGQSVTKFVLMDQTERF